MGFCCSCSGVNLLSESPSWLTAPPSWSVPNAAAGPPWFITNWPILDPTDRSASAASGASPHPPDITPITAAGIKLIAFIAKYWVHPTSPGDGMCSPVASSVPLPNMLALTACCPAGVIEVMTSCTCCVSTCRPSSMCCATPGSPPICVQAHLAALSVSAPASTALAYVFLT